MKNGILLLSIVFGIHAQASELSECRTKIAEIVNHVPKTTTKGVGGNTDQYHLSSDGTCGVEFVEDKGYFTVAEFLAGSTPANTTFKKFETILMNEDYAEGRIHGVTTCEINNDSVTYVTTLPLFSDGVRTPHQIKTLTVSLIDGKVSVNLKAKAMVLASTVFCNL